MTWRANQSQAFAMRGGSGGGGDIGNANVWDGATLAAAIAAAGADLADGDVLRVGDDAELFRRITNAAGAIGSYELPSAVGGTGAIGPGSLLCGFRSADPVEAELADWAYIGEDGSPSYTVTGGVLTIGTPVDTDVGAIVFDDGVGSSAQRVIVIEDMSAVCAAAAANNRPYIDIPLGTGDRYVRLRPQGTATDSAWGIQTTGSDIAMAGAEIGTPSTLELYAIATAPASIAYRWGRAGAWTVASGTLPPFATTRGFLALSRYSSGAQSISMRAAYVQEM